MALQKNITRGGGLVCNHIKITKAPVDYLAKEISVHFALYFNAAAAADDAPNPIVEVIAKLRLTGAKFDEWLSTAALAANPAADPFRAQLYAAAKIEPLIAGGGLIAISFADATDV